MQKKIQLLQIFTSSGKRKSKTFFFFFKGRGMRGCIDRGEEINFLHENESQKLTRLKYK